MSVLSTIEYSPLQRRLAFAGVVLFTIGLFTGLWTGYSFTMRHDLAFPRLALAAHLNGLLGGLWILAVAFTLPFLSYGSRGMSRLALAVVVPSYANWIVTLLASMLDARGLSYGEGMHNDVIAGLLQTGVVLPALVAACAWTWGFRRR